MSQPYIISSQGGPGRRVTALAEAIVASKSFASRLLRPIQAKKRSTTQNPASRLDGEADLIGGLAHDLEGASSPMPATLANASPAPPQSLDEGE